MREYLPSLQQRSKMLSKARDFRVGDPCLLEETNLDHRAYWPLRRVTNVRRSDDGCVRAVRVKSAKGEYHRPVNKLCLL